MIMKERSKPLILRKLEALLRRISPNHPARPAIESELIKSSTGYRGEKLVDYHINFLPVNDYCIFHDLRLHDGHHYFQMDTLIVSSSSMFILEIKNIAGTLYFDEQFQQLIRTYNGFEEGLPCPISQVKRHRLQLEKWLQLYNFPIVPIEPLVIVSHPSTIIKSSTPDISNVFHAAAIPFKIELLQKNYPNQLLSKKDLKRLSNLLINKHTPSDPDVFQKFNLNQSELCKGVHCPQCSMIPMFRKKGEWCCTVCDFRSKDAHLDSLRDYSALFGQLITNQQLRNFLNISSRTVATMILNSLKTNRTGSTKGREYMLKFEKE